MMTAEQLKASILQLAMEGKLVKQRANDKPIKPYIESLKTKQKKLIAQKIIKKEKFDSSIDEEVEVPDKWCVFKLGEITEVVTKQTGFDYSKTIKPNLSNVKLQGYIPFLQTKNFKGKTFDLNTDYFLSEEIAKRFPKILLDSECLLLSIVGASIGNVGIYDGKILAMLGGAICKVKLLDNKLYDYLYYYLKSPIGQEEIKKNLKATAQGTITVQDVREVLIKLPPFEEQHRIIQKIEELKPFIDEYATASEKLDKLNTEFPTQVKKSILQMAVEGKLVEQRPEEGTGKELYRKIQEEKSKLIKEGKIKKQKPLAEIADDEKPFDIPESWAWVRMNDCTDVRDGTHNSPKYHSEGIPLVTSKNLRNGKIDFSTCKLISMEDHNMIDLRSKVDNDDILFAMIGTVGNPVLYRGKEEFSIKNMALFKHIESYMNMEYVYWYLLLAQYNMQRQASGGVQNFVSLNYLRSYPIPIPPRDEQDRIVLKLNDAFKKLKMLTGYICK